MKRSSVALLVLVGLGCGGRYHAGTTPEPQTSAAALEQFLAAVKAKNSRRLAELWGNEKGPLAATGQLRPTYVDSVVQVFQVYLRHNGYRVVDGPKPIMGTQNSVTYHVELQLPDCNRVQPLDLTRTRSGGWVVSDPHLEAAAQLVPHCDVTRGNTR